jgi:hypothetical protein
MSSCIESVCDDAIDNDTDGYLDCSDEDCIGDSACTDAAWVWIDGGQGQHHTRNAWGHSSGSFAKKSSMQIDSPTGHASFQGSSSTYSCNWSASSFLAYASTGSSFAQTATIYGLSSTGACAGLLQTSHFRGRAGFWISSSTGFRASFNVPRFYANGNMVVDGTISSTSSVRRTSGSWGSIKYYYDFSVKPSNPWPHP